MKKKLTLILSIVLVLAVAVCAVLFATATSESSTHFAQTEAKTRWEAAENYWSTKVWFNNTTISDGATGKLVDLLGASCGADADSTYTLNDGVLTLSGNGETVKVTDLGADGALWLVLDNISTDGRIRPYYKGGWTALYGNQYPSQDMPLIISSPIDGEFNVKDPSDTVKGGMVMNTGSASNAIRTHGSLILLGDVGFNVGKGTDSGDSVTCLNGNLSSFAIILAPGRDSVVNSKSVSYNNGTGRDVQAGTGVLQIFGSIFDDKDVTITLHNRINAPNGIVLDDGANLNLIGETAYVVASTNGVELKDGSTLVVDTELTTPMLLPASNGLKVDATSTVYYKQGDTYTFPVAGNYKVGDSIFTVDAGSKLDSATELSFVRTSDAATVGAVIHTDASGVKTALVDLPGNGATAILNGAVSYDNDTKTVTLSNVTGNSLHFNIPGDFTVNVTGDSNVLGTAATTYVVQSTGSGTMTLAGTGTLKINAKNNAIAASGSYKQTQTSVEINSADQATVIKATDNIDILGGSLKVTGNGNGVLSAGKNTNISSQPGSLTYVDISAYANVINGNNTTVNISGEEYNETAKTGTYVKIVATGDYGIRTKTVNILGGTVNLDVAKGNGIYASGNLTISGGNVTVKETTNEGLNSGASLSISGADTVVNVYAPGGRAINAKSVNISGGTVNTFIMNGTTELRSKYGITSTTDGLVISGGKVNAHIAENSAICAYNRGNVEISGDAVVDVWAKSSGILARFGNVKISGTADVDVTVVGALGIVAGDVNAIEISGGTVDVNGAPAKDLGVMQATTYTQTGGTVTTTARDGSNGYALKATNITINQDAKLNAYALDTDSTTNHAIFAATNMTVNGGEVVAISKNQRAISSDDGNFTLNGGKVSTYGNVNGTDMTTQYGICVQNIKVTGGTADIKGLQNSAFAGWNSVLIEGGTVSVASGSGSIHSNKTVEVIGGTVNVKAEAGVGISANTSITVKGTAVVNAYAKAGRALDSNYVSISSGTVNTTLLEGTKLLRSKYGITGNNVDISGGTVNAYISTNSAIFADAGNLVISGGTVNVDTLSNGLRASGDVKVTNGTVNVYAAHALAVATKNFVVEGGVVDLESLQAPTVSASGSVTVSGGALNLSTNSAYAIQAKTASVENGAVDLRGGNDTALFYVADGSQVNLTGGKVTGIVGYFIQYNNNADNKIKITDGAMLDVYYTQSTFKNNGENKDGVLTEDIANTVTWLKDCGWTQNKHWLTTANWLNGANGSATRVILTLKDNSLFGLDLDGNRCYPSAENPIFTLSATGDLYALNLAGSDVEAGKIRKLQANGNLNFELPANKVIHIGDDDITNAVDIFGTLTVFGEGTLKVKSKETGIVVGKDYNQTSATVEVDVAGGSGIKSSAKVNLTGGTVNVKAEAGSGISATTSITVSENAVVNVYAKAGRALDSNYVSITGGTVNTTLLEGTTLLRSKYGITGNNVDISGGTVNAYISANSAIFADAGSIVISGGTVNVDTLSSGLRATADVKITNGTVNVYAAHATAVTAKNFIVEGGEVAVRSMRAPTVTASDKVTVSGGTVTATSAAEQAILATNSVNISGGTVTATATKSAIMSNNSVNISGGTVTATATSAERAIDAGALVNITGGTVTANAAEVGIGAPNIKIDGANTVVYAYSKNNRSMDAQNITISNGTVNTYILDNSGNPVLAKYGITSNDGNLTITGGTVNAKVTTSHALYAINGTIDISGGAVNATAPGTTVSISKGDLKVSGGTLTAEATTGAYTIIIGSQDNPGNVIVSGGTLTATAMNSGRAIQLYNGDVKVTGGTVNAEVKADTAIEAKNVIVENGTLNATAGARNAIYASNSMSVSGGTVKVVGIPPKNNQVVLHTTTYTQTGGNVTVYGKSGSAGHNLQATNMTVSNGVLNLFSATQRAANILGNVTITGGTVNTFGEIDGTTVTSRYGIFVQGKITISGGTVNAKALGNNALWGKKAIEISGGTINGYAGTRSIFTSEGDVLISNGNLSLTIAGNDDAIRGKNITVTGGTIDIQGTKENSLFGLYNGSSLNVTGGTITGILGYVITYDDKAENKVKITDGAKIDLYYINDTFRDGGNTLDDAEVANNIWLKSAGWSDNKHWLTTANWLNGANGSATRVILTLKDNSLFGLDLDGNRFYPSAENPVFALSATGDLYALNLEGSDVEAGKIRKLQANGNLNFELPANTIINIGDANITNAVEILGALTISGDGTLKIKSKNGGMRIEGDYNQPSATVEVDAAGGSGVYSGANINITGGTLKITGNANGALTSAVETNISSQPGSFTYVDITAYANAINGDNTTINVSGEEYDETAKTGTYLKVVTPKDHCLRVKNINISGGTLNVSASNRTIEGYDSVKISGGNVTATSNGADTIYSSGKLEITGGTVTSTSETSDRALYGNPLEISQANDSIPTVVNATANVYVVRSSVDINISGGTLNVTCRKGRGIQAGENVNVTGGTITVDVTNDVGIEGKNVFIDMEGDDDSLTITTGTSSGIYAPELISISDGKVDVTSNVNAIWSAKTVDISGGDITATTAKDYTIRGIDVNVSGGTVTATSTAGTKAIYGSNEIKISQKDASVATVVTATSKGADTIYALGKLEITGGTVTSTSETSDRALFGNPLEISQANASIPTVVNATANIYVVRSSEDINLSGGTLNVTCRRGRGIQAGGNVNITGGKITVDVTNDVGIEGKSVFINMEGDDDFLKVKTGTTSGIYAPELISISNGKVDVTSGVNAIYSAKTVDISGGDVTATTASGYSLRGVDVNISGGTVKAIGAAGTNAGVIYATNYNQTNGDVTVIATAGRAILVDNLNISGGKIKSYDEEKTSGLGFLARQSVDISGGTVDVKITGNYAIQCGKVKIHQADPNVPTNVSVEAYIYGIVATTLEVTDVPSLKVVATRGRAIQGNGDVTIVNSNVAASAGNDIAIEGKNIVVKDSTVTASANSGKSVYALSSLVISGGEFTSTMKNSSAIHVEGDFIVQDNAVVNAIANNCRSTGGALYAYSFYMLGEKGDKGPQVNVTMNSAEFKKGELRQIRGVQIGGPTYKPGEVVLEGGNLTITINNNYADPEYEYNKKKNDVSTNRSVGFAFNNLESVDFAGTNVVVDLNTQLNNYKTSGFMWVYGSIPTQITVSDGLLKCDGNGDVQAMFYSEVNENKFDIVGGKITGAAKYFWFSERLNQVLTVKPGASIDFYNYSGRSVSLGRANAHNGTTPSWFEDDGVEYLRGCSLSSNSQYLTTGTDELATHVEILVQEGNTTKVYVLNEDYPAYPVNADSETAQAYYVGDGVVVLKNLKANQIRSNGRVTLNLKGESTVSAEGQHRIRSMGDIVVSGDGVLNVTGTTYVFYSYRGDEILIKDKAQLNVVATTGCGIHINHNTVPVTGITITDDAKVHVESVSQAIYIRGLETFVTIDGNATAELNSRNNYGIGAFGNAAKEVVHKATVNIGENAKVLFDGKSGINANGQIAAINVNGNAIVDVNSNRGYPFNVSGANPSVNISGNAKIHVAEGASDVFNLNSNALAMEGIKQEASVNISGKASFIAGRAVNCAARINLSAKNAEGKAVAGKSIFHVSEEGFADLNSDGQTIYLMAPSADSVASLKVTDKANLNVSNLSDTGYAAIQMNGMTSNVEFTTKGTINVTGKVPGGTGAVRILHPSKGKNEILIKDATVNITNIQSTEKETLNAAGNNTYAGDRSIALQINNESDIVIGGKAVVNLRAERNGKKYANTAFGLYITGTAGATKLTIQDRAQLNATSGGNANMNLGSGIFVQDCDIVVTDNATLRGAAVGTSIAGINFSRSSNLTVEKYGMAYFTGEFNKAYGMTGYNSSTKASVTVKDGGRIYFSANLIAINLKTGSFTFAASSMEAGKTEEELKEEKLDLLNRNYSKYGYVVLKGEMENPRTSDAMLTTVITVTVLVAAAAVAVTIIRKKKSKAN